MKKLLFIFTLCILITGMAFGQRVASAVVSLRPTHIDISDATTESAVLMTLSGYSSDDARYRLYNSSYQYNCWNEDNDTWVSSTTYANGPKVPGTPSSSTTFWIMFQRGNNNNTSASYRDRLGTSYGSNYQKVALPPATSITTPFTLSGTYTGSTSVKNVVLGFAGPILVTAASTALSNGNFSLSVPTGTTIDKIEVRKVDNTTLGSVTGSWSSTASNISISGSTPTITVNPATLTGFSYAQGSGPSSEKTFTVQGSNLTADINITVPTSPAQHYEISKTSGGTFSSSLTLTQSGGTVSETTIYVRLKAGLSAGNYNNETITVSSTGATSKTVTCSGTVCKPEPSNHCTNFTAANGTDPKTQITLSWTDATGSIIPDGYLIKAATGDYSNIVNPVDGTAETDGTYVKNIAAGVQTATFSNLNSSTTYYFKIFPYTNSGTYINYKTDGTIPQISRTTASGPTIVEIILPQYIQGLNGTNNQRLPWACRLKLENLVANSTYKYFGQFVVSTDDASTNGAGIGWFVNSDNTISRNTSVGMSTE